METEPLTQLLNKQDFSRDSLVPLPSPNAQDILVPR
jgi:hypothetical protein